jgi:thymidylate synthase (FAD)
MNDARKSSFAPESSSLRKAEKLTRCSSPALDEILGHAFPVLDDGFVRVVDYMGNDGSIVQAARVSYGSGTEKPAEDRTMVRHLMRHLHTTPFEMCELKLHVRTPMDVWRQWIRHRMANVNEYSTRASIASSAQKTQAGEWRLQSAKSKQLGSTFLAVEEGQALSARELELQKMSREVYDERVAAGIAGEQARKDLLLSTYTEAYWKIDLHNLLHFLHLRMDDHAQNEIRSYARVIANEIVARWVPFAWEAFLDYRRESLTLSRTESQIVTALAANAPDEARAVAESAGLLTTNRSGKLVSNLERTELDAKLATLGLTPPWK